MVIKNRHRQGGRRKGEGLLFSPLVDVWASPPASTLRPLQSGAVDLVDTPWQLKAGSLPSFTPVTIAATMLVCTETISSESSTTFPASFFSFSCPSVSLELPGVT